MATPAWNAAFACTNLADSGTWSAASSVAQMLPSKLQDPHVARKWRGGTNSVALVCDLGAAKSLDTIFLAGVNLTATGLTAVAISATDPSGIAGELHNGPVAAGRVDPKYGRFAYFLSAPVSGRYVRISLDDASLSNVEAGRGAIMLRTQVGINFAFGASDTPNDPAIKRKGRGGQTFVDPASPDPFRVWEFSFDTVTETERFGFVEEIDRLNGTRTDVLLCRDPSSSNLGRDTMWGLLEATPVVAQSGFIAGAPVYSKVYRIEQRL